MPVSELSGFAIVDRRTDSQTRRLFVTVQRKTVALLDGVRPIEDWTELTSSYCRILCNDGARKHLNEYLKEYLKLSF